MTAHRGVRRSFASITAIAIFAVMAAILMPFAASSPADAATASDFRDGNIISDQNFTDSGSMSADAVQAFLNGKVSNCRASNGWPCLKDYSQETQNRAADAYCRSMPGGRMSGAEIIVSAAKACGINPKTLLVMLQKEQGLITDASPRSWSYSAALGQSCPDNAQCDPAYSGFFNQVFFGARQLQMYLAKPQWYAYQLGWNDILYSPESGCGTKRVNILNDATRALYIYTPYTPNSSALANLYGTGDRCASYGNRNFWRTYADWFGDPLSSYEVRGEMGSRWRALGASSGVLGTPVANEVCNWTPGNVNCYQNFAYGAISWTAATGAWETYGAIRSRWLLITAERSEIGYPVGAPTCGTRGGGCYQNFQNGAISWIEALGAWETFGSIRTAWLTAGAENGALGYPVSEITCGAGVCEQPFETGTVVATSRATYRVTGAIEARWRGVGGSSGALGAPTSAETCTWTGSANCVQNFANGAITWTPSTGAWETYGAVRTYWKKTGAERSALGYPSGPPETVSGVTSQRFQWGTVVATDSGAVRLLGSINDRWLALGGVRGTLGATTSEESCFPTAAVPNCYQNFQKGAISWTAKTGAWETYGPIRSRWLALGFEAGVLGYPTGGVICSSSGDACSQSFQKGAISWTARTGAWETYGPIRARWSDIDAESGALGYPIGPVTCGTRDGGCFQDFQHGSISRTASTGSWETYGPIRAYWGGLGYENGILGYPTSSVMTSGTESRQTFQGGVVIWDRSTNSVTRN